MKFLQWAGTTLVGNIILAEIFASVPFFLVFLGLNYSEGTLTPFWVMYLVIISIVLGGVGGILVWYFVTLPQLEKKKRGFR